MVKELYHAFQGKRIWECYCRKYSISNSCVTIVLMEDYALWNACAIRYLPAFMKRKSAKRALILVKNGLHIDISEVRNAVLKRIKEKDAERLLNYYTLFRFSDNLVFFYTNRPQDNRSEFILKHTEITMDELICLGLYRLREVPEYV